MFYETLGDLLCAAAQTLQREVRPEVSDDRARTQLDAAIALATDVGTMWAGLFEGVGLENRIYEEALGLPLSQSGDPLAHHQELVGVINKRITDLHAEDSQLSRGEMIVIRRALSEAAEVRQSILDRAAVGVGQMPTRRM